MFDTLSIVIWMNNSLVKFHWLFILCVYVSNWPCWLFVITLYKLCKAQSKNWHFLFWISDWKENQNYNEVANETFSPCLLTDRDETSNLHRGHSIDDSYQVSVVAMFVNWSGRNKQSFLIFSSENPRPNELKLGMKHLWKVLSKECTFCYDPLPNTAATGNSCFWLADLKKKSSPLKVLSQMNRNLVWSNYGRSSIKIAHFIPIRWQTWSPSIMLTLTLQISKLTKAVVLNSFPHGRFWQFVCKENARCTWLMQRS
jgi:hypothetical protein